jgi:hypothetical protein
MYSYKTIPAPMVLGVKKEKDVNNAIRGFSDIINAECTDGWEFYSMETMTTQVPQGCMSGATKTMTYNMLVFRKEK